MLRLQTDTILDARHKSSVSTPVGVNGIIVKSLGILHRRRIFRPANLDAAP